MERAYKSLFFETVSSSHSRPCINNSCVQRPHSRPQNIHLHKQAGSRHTSRNFALVRDRVHKTLLLDPVMTHITFVYDTFT